MRDVTSASFEAWRAAEQRRGVKAKTLNEYLCHVRSFLGWLEERQMIQVNPLRILKPLRVVREDSKRAFTLEELRQLVKAAPPSRASQYILAAYTGLRRAELKTLEWNRITLDAEFSRIELSPGKTKNRKGGTLPLHPDALKALCDLKGDAPPGGRLVFPKGVSTVRTFRKDLADAGIASFDGRGRGLEFHSFRRTWATFLNASGIAPRSAMELMRHSDLRLTMRDYTDENLLPLASELQRVPSLKSSPLSSPKSGKPRPSVSTSGQTETLEGSAKPAEDEQFGLDLNSAVPLCPGKEMADREGFEPSVPFPAHTLSRRARSTTPAPVHFGEADFRPCR